MGQYDYEADKVWLATDNDVPTASLRTSLLVAYLAI